MARVRKNDPVMSHQHAKLHILDHGSTFNLHTRVAAAAPAVVQRVEDLWSPAPEVEAVLLGQNDAP